MQNNSERDSIDRMVDAYERMLEFVHQGVERLEDEAMPALRERLDRAREKMFELGELTREEAERLSIYLGRDLEDAGRYLLETESEFKTWLSFDIGLIETRLLDMLTSVADQTSVELAQLSERAHHPSYHTGELAGPGSLMCTTCGQQIQFHKAGRIPPCPQCHSTDFQRLHASTAD
jgi:hypothetical protein